MKRPLCKTRGGDGRCNCRFRQTVALLLIPLSSTTLATCPAKKFDEQLTGSFTVSVPDASSKLIAVDQRGMDVEIYIDSTTSFWINSPAGRNSPDFLYLENSSGNVSELILCTYSTLAHAPAPQLSLRQEGVIAPNATTRELLQLTNKAGSDWQSGKADGLIASAELYARIAEELTATSPLLQELKLVARVNAAMVNSQLREYKQAMQLLTPLLDSTANNPFIYPKVLLEYGRSSFRAAQIEASIEYLERGRSYIAQRSPDEQAWLRYDRAEIGSMLGEAYVFVKQLDTASAVLDAAIEDAASDFSLLADIYNNKGLVSIKRAEVTSDRSQKNAILNTSTEEHLMAAYFAEQARDLPWLQIIENNVAVHYARIGERRKSMSHFLNVLRLMDAVENPGARAFLYSNLSNYSQILGDYAKSASYLLESIRFDPDPPVPPNASIPNVYCRLGTLYRLLEEPLKSIIEHTNCIDYARKTNDTRSQVEGNLQLSVDYLQRNELERAEGYIEASLAMLAGFSDANLQRRVWNQVVEVYIAQGRLQDAERTVKQALSVEIAETYANDSIASLALAMRVEELLKNPQAAIGYGNAAIEKIEQMHLQLDAERLGPAWGNQTNAVYQAQAENYLSVYATTGDAEQLEQAFATIEQSRDISLRQRLGSTLAVDSLSLEQQKQLEVYSKISRVLADDSADATLPAMTVDYYHQHDLLALARLNNVESLPVPPPFSLTDVQAKLKPSQAVLYYTVSGDEFQLMTISKQAVVLGDKQSLSVVLALLTNIDETLHGTGSLPIDVLQQLSPLLLPDPAQLAGASELLMVGDTGLNAVPFGALTTGQGYNPLVKQYTLTSVPSLSSYFMTKPERTVDYSAAVAVFADPVFDNIELASLDSSLATVGNLRGWSDSLQALPYTAEEARNIAAIVPGSTLSFTGVNATRANLGSIAARNAHVLHIATHGYFKSTSEDNVGLALSTVDDAGRRDPGFITLTELFGYAFNNELVVISGCDTAMGKEQAGSGLNSLTRGFLVQGVKHVISTLWPVSDRASAEFMRLFYQELQKSSDVAKALQTAQQQLSSNASYRNPYYWAGYVLTSVSPDATISLAD